RNPKPDTRNPKPETRHPTPDTRHPKPKTRNPTPETRNPGPETRDRIRRGTTEEVERVEGSRSHHWRHGQLLLHGSRGAPITLQTCSL
ncbi:hypothetical protein T484DRAFT_1638037, partial [Baffinella frigidus]